MGGNSSHSPYLQIHDFVVHIRPQDPALVKEPRLFDVDDALARRQHVAAPRHAVEKGEAAADTVEDGLGGGVGEVLAEVAMAVALQGGRCHIYTSDAAADMQ